MALLDLLKQGPVTQQLALQKLGLFRLAEAINKLREDGHKISTVIKARQGRVICEYHLKEK
jgi:hypothetical protein